ncbi:hypothetical protein B2J86_00435 [Acidovorax sp. SRB_14]|uniref:hypothetical protein n=1 Tax=Acidovorax sp. SRB_14 TaxID=1962699 RepID=UPI001563E133|nr:hypothetical protein [Acidovorax sp. SRB_14]NMM79409.1 hypothetical protein [Acidovorax sp. SRB_14]
MKKKHWMALVAASALGGAWGISTTALAQDNTAELMRGERPDTTPQQRYQSAIREAGGGLKVALQECRGEPTAQRKSCEADARANYKQDMAQAQEMLRNPQARPVNEVGQPVQATETTTVIGP